MNVTGNSRIRIASRSVPDTVAKKSVEKKQAPMKFAQYVRYTKLPKMRVTVGLYTFGGTPR